MIAPPPEGLDAPGRAAWAALTGPPIAHRGLWSAVAPENSLTAFAAACAAGYGVELDVRLSRDRVPTVFHDEDLSRLTGHEGGVEDHLSSDLRRMRINELAEMPTLGETLRLVNGQTLLLIELKPKANADHLVERTLDVLEGYHGPFALIAFDPDVHASLARRSPDSLRGAHIASSDVEAVSAREARAHFALPALDALRRPATLALRSAGLPAIGWTSRSPGEHTRALDWADNLIFEGFRP